jgi:hypothetical protein
VDVELEEEVEGHILVGLEERQEGEAVCDDLHALLEAL